MDNQIICPYCNKAIELTAALSHKIEEQLSKKYQVETQVLQEKLKAKDQEVEKQKRAMWEKALVLADKKIQEKEAQKIAFLETELDRQKKKVEEVQKNELDLRKEKVRLEEKEKELELKVQRTIDLERQKIIEKVVNEHRLSDLEKEKKLQDALKMVEDYKRKLSQGSQQLQGEVLELELVNILHKEFPYDEIKDVPKGVRGADVLQIVKNSYGRVCGSIIWELKRTKGWTDSWINKLKEDQRQLKAEVAVIISQVLPENIKQLGQINGVWVGDFESIISLSLLLRNSLIELSLVKSSVVGKQEKKEILWNYFTSTEFKQRFEAMYDAYQQSKIHLDKEKEFFRRKWAREEKSTQLLMENLLGIHGDLQAIIGRSLPEIKGLEMLPESVKNDEDVKPMF